MSLIDPWVGDPPPPPPADRYGAGCRVLVAEDDDEMRALLASTLKCDGFEVVEAKNGLELLDYLLPWFSGREPPAHVDAIVSDIQMPCFTGMEVLAGLSAVRRRPPIVLITAFGESSTHALARSLGAAAVLDKPFDLDALRGVMSRVIAARPAPEDPG
ncbi:MULTISPECIES: response regulator [Sorangium]|uniref:Response regulatory domain-containing protein n=2 Tax=Sorangium cellulosum TaxID=56 RepID=A0A150TQK1_SORCE|nr:MULTISPECIES: response regulator [Sorangium]AUX29528.1 hypothetical protein SOCE836_016180 [Sorangium cellulosum]KYF81061.1 hypothetical protein BE18_24040 [Sorangium cellulosum]KYG06952.1 hypothetical protein BE21_31890 [Sorangium cellulosum]WCQ88924.1 hypothetical protein NQZ70_01606 [Sorangium sp. Soce836]